MLRLVLLALLGSALGACGGSSDQNPSQDADPESPASSSAEDPNNPWALAWIVTGSEGTGFGTVETLTVNDAEQTQEGARTLDASGRFEWPYTQFVDQVSIVVTADGPITFDLVIARFADAGSNSTELEVREVLSSSEVAPGEETLVEGQLADS